MASALHLARFSALAAQPQPSTPPNAADKAPRPPFRQSPASSGQRHQEARFRPFEPHSEPSDRFSLPPTPPRTPFLLYPFSHISASPTTDIGSLHHRPISSPQPSGATHPPKASHRFPQAADPEFITAALHRLRSVID
ncbi:hypothetical protein E4U22_000616 [Claviceps purpurea]|nr:hypothetical protein E4U48_000080 [Claviceps purpurea]KAG6307947.1 hypothetical protein E4U45_003060 [Claviceps purpurea]KAG6313811.1 hypothetical protein E4U22_000616 [Claviceps purpurea]